MLSDSASGIENRRAFTGPVSSNLTLCRQNQRMHMDLEELLSRVALAFGIGLLVGLERGWRAREGGPGSRAAGVRTFAITGLLGGVVAALGTGPDGALTMAGSVLLGAAFIAYAAVIALFARDENKATHSHSATTAIAALLTFMLGAYALIGNVYVVAASAVAATGILVVREELHEWVRKITLPELQSGLVLLAMTFIVLPLVPDRRIGPFGGVDPREIWIIAIALAAVSFAGYVAVKVLGARRGVLLAAGIGGLVSSTAVTFLNARRAAAGEGSARLLAAGVALATAVSFVRVAAIIAVLKPSLVRLTAPALLVGAIVAAAFAIVPALSRSAELEKQEPLQFHNPFGFLPVVGMAVAMGVLVVVGRLIYEEFGAVGAIAGAATMGLFDVDAMVVSMTQMVPQPLQLQAATFAILTGVASNTFTKIVIGSLMGRGAFAVQIVVASIASVIAGWLVLWATLSLGQV